jgi:hypothetical protein
MSLFVCIVDLTGVPWKRRLIILVVLPVGPFEKFSEGRQTKE